MGKGICVAGNAMMDVIYRIESYPRRKELTTITGFARYTGGPLCNVAMNLARLDPAIDIYAVGRVGDDADADYIEQQMEQYASISLAGVKRKGDTSFTAVMSENSTKYRTFFQFRGANAQLGEGDFDWERIDTKLMHIGYILLLDELDKGDAEYGTKMARVLHTAQRKGIKTSIDLVSEMSDRYKELVPPSLKYTDYCTINQIEAQQTTGVKLRDGDGRLIRGNMKEALGALLGMGVATWAIIHTTEAAFGMDKKGRYVEQDSVALPPGYIKGTVGGGDAFCSGVLYAAYHDKSLHEAVVMGIAAATCSISGEGANEVMYSMPEVMRRYKLLRQ